MQDDLNMDYTEFIFHTSCSLQSQSSIYNGPRQDNTNHGNLPLFFLWYKILDKFLYELSYKDTESKPCVHTVRRNLVRL